MCRTCSVLPALWPAARRLDGRRARCRRSCIARSTSAPGRCGCGCCPRCCRSRGLMHWAINIAALGRASRRHVRGGGRRARTASASTRSWHMIAEGDDGPFIPAMACAAIIRNCLDGQRPAPGARPATGDLELEDYERLFARRAIHAGMREVPPRRPRCRSIAGCSATPRTRCPRRCRRCTICSDAHERRGDRHGDARQRPARAACGGADRLSARGRERAAARRLQGRGRPRALDAHIRGPLVPQRRRSRAAAASNGSCASASARSASAWRWCSTMGGCG